MPPMKLLAGLQSKANGSTAQGPNTHVLTICMVSFNLDCFSQ
jgi:hypothetical protein